jgi:putative membrane-bound dehydrogenase-like protein
LFLKDTDGDGTADVRKPLIEGWGTYDTHAGPSNLRYGFDNQIWGVVGYSGFTGNIAGQDRDFKQGIYRFKPDVSSFEFMTSTSNNTWGLGFTENNDVFASTANNTHSVFMGIPDKAAKSVEGIDVNGSLKLDGHYAMHPVTPNVRQVDVFGGFTAAAGHNFYTARDYPKEFWNQVAFVCEPTGHLVHIARIDKNGAGFVEKDGWNLFSSVDEWVSPVDAKVGPDGAVWILDWYDFIVQHNPTPTPDRGGYAAENGKGNAYENPLRDKSYGRIWRVVSHQSKQDEILQLEVDDADDLIEALGHDNMFWRLTAQRLLVERGNLDVLPKLYDLIRDEKVDELGYNYAATHALWVVDGLGALHKDDKAEGKVADALKHKSAGVRKAALQILSGGRLTEQTVVQMKILNDPDPNTRLAAILSLMDISPSAVLGKALYTLSLEEDVKNDYWLSQAVYVAANQHRDGFIAAFREANPGYAKPEIKVIQREAKDLDDTAWKTMELPQSIEKAGLDIDGVIWFRTIVTVPQNVARQKATLSLGPIDDSDDTFVNSLRVGGLINQSNENRVYTIPSGTLKPGKNSIAIKVNDSRGRGGIHGKKEDMFLQVGSQKIPVSGSWKYEVEKEFHPKNPFKDASISETFVNTYLNKEEIEDPNGSAPGGATVIQIKVVKNEMKFDRKTFEVVAGKPVEIIFENPDFMQHNLVITQIGALENVGKAADKLASDPKGAEKQYIPEMSEVLFATELVNPEQTVRLQFVAPEQAGDYPFVCTFPGHWSMMNGTMKVVKSKSSL